MKYCKQGLCPLDNVEKCCAFCEKRTDCKDICQNVYKTDCEHMAEHETGLVEFKNKEVALIQAICNLEAQKAEIFKKCDDMRASLLVAMEQYQLKSYENEHIKFTYIAPTTRNSIDSTKLKKELPEIAEKYTKTSNVKASVKITLK